MVLGTMLLVLCLAIAFFHYVQGLLTSALSAILVTFAAVLALGMHETLAKVLINLKYPEQAASVSLVALFAGCYFIPRVLLDMAVPGNVRFPVLVEKVGAGVFGLWVGLIATGIFAIAAQALPMWPTVGGYARYDVVTDRSQDGVRISGYSQGQMVKFDTETVDDNLNPQPDNPLHTGHLFLHQDDLVMGLVAHESDGGALAGEVPWSSIHPDYLTELFGQRLGLQIGVKRTVSSTGVSLVGVYATPDLPQVDGEIAAMRQSSTTVPKTLSAGEGKVLLVVRLAFNGSEAADSADSKFRFGPGNIRLCTDVSDSDTAKYQDFYPVAVLRKGQAIFQRCDDFLIVDCKAAPTIDFIFAVDANAIETDSKKARKLHQGTFVSVKRYGIVDLSGQKLQTDIPANPTPDAIIRKPDVSKTFPQETPSQADMQALQGTWTVVSVEFMGKPIPNHDQGVFVFEGNNMTRPDGKCVITLDATKSPKQVDATESNGGKTALGIYDLNGDTLRICNGGSAGRPTSFATQADSPQVLLVLNRKK